MFWKLLVERCIRAALASGLAVIATAAAAPDFSVPKAKAALVAAGAAAISAVITLVSQAVGDPTSTSFLKGAPGTD